MQLRVKTLHAGSFHVELSDGESTLVERLKQLIEEQRGEQEAAQDRQRIIFRGKVLKHGHRLSDYGIEADSTVHLVVRPVSAPAPEPNAAPSDAAADAAQQHPATGTTHFMSGPPGSGSVLMSTININEGAALPDLNNIVQSMLRSVPNALQGVSIPVVAPSAEAPRPSTVAQPAASTAVTIDGIRQALNTVSQLVPTVSASAQLSRGVSDLPLSQNVPAVGQLAAQLQALLSRVQAALDEVQPSLLTPSQVLEQHEREDVQSTAHELGTALVSLSGAMQSIGHTLTQVELGASPGQEQLLSGPQQQHEQAQIQVHISTHNLPNEQQQQQVEAQAQTQARAAAPAAPAAPASTSSTAPASGVDMSSIFQMLGPMMQSMGSQPAAEATVPAASAPTPAPAAPAAAPAATSTGSAAPAPAFNISSVFNALGPMMSGVAAAASGSSSGGSTDAASSAGGSGGGGLSGLMNMLGPMMQSLSQQSAPSATTASAAPAAAPPASRSAMFPPLSSIFPPSDTNEDSDSTGLIDTIMSSAMQNLTMPDLIAMVSGNWTCLDRMQEPLANAVREQAFDGNDNAEARQQLVDDVSAYACGLFTSEEALAELSSRRTDPSADIAADAFNCVRPYANDAIEALLSPPSTEPPLFSSRIRELSSDLIGELVEYLSHQFEGGRDTVSSVFRAMVVQRMSSLGPQFSMFVSMGSQSFVRIVQRCHDNFLARRALRTDASGSEAWRQSLGNAEGQEWSRVIQLDQHRQREALLSAPSTSFSDSYVDGHAAKRRRLAQQARVPRDKPVNLADSVRKQLKRAVREAQGQAQATSDSSVAQQRHEQEQLIDRIAADQDSPLVRAYRQRLVDDLRELVVGNPDMDRQRFPAISENLLGNEPEQGFGADEDQPRQARN